MTKHLVIIGRSESIDLLDTGSNVPAKIDTGAYRSAVHSSNIRVVQDDDGNDILKATLLGHPLHPQTYEVEFKDFEKVSVTNSFGGQENRYCVKLRVKLGSKSVTTAFTLADRSKNFFPILLGRTLLKRRFIVDVATSGLSDRSILKKTYKGITPDDLIE